MRVDTISPSGIHVYNAYRYSSPQYGIYTCKKTDSANADMSIGVYSTLGKSHPAVLFLLLSTYVYVYRITIFK